MNKNWKSNLIGSGFHESEGENGVLIKESGHFKQSVWEGRSRFEKNKVVINLAVSVHDDFLPLPDHVAVIVAHLHESGVVIMNQGEGRWWDKTESDAALASLLSYGSPWLERYSDPQRLISFLEHGAQDNASPKFDGWTARLAERLMLRQAGAAPSHASRPPIHYYHLSLLYYLTGDTRRSCENASEYLRFVQARSIPNEPERTLRQIERMNCPAIG